QQRSEDLGLRTLLLDLFRGAPNRSRIFYFRRRERDAAQLLAARRLQMRKDRRGQRRAVERLRAGFLAKLIQSFVDIGLKFRKLVVDVAQALVDVSLNGLLQAVFKFFAH